ncbi:MAG: 3-deoxy-8-phosphooctulonate synthase [Deltaproteobacteria bacterium]|nr:3-deoxy-8-phosphooctulonate synthase [Deltaproteobacteria bacterium]
MSPVLVGGVEIGAGQGLVLVAGPCVIESRAHLLRIGEEVQTIARDAGVPFVLKSSYDKANRTSIDAYRGPGLEAGLRILEAARRELGVAVLTDVHEVCQVAPAAEVVDALQIPAFLCRQTDLILAAAHSGKPVNVKKGQLLSPEDAIHIVHKIESTGNRQILLTERGSAFGYHRLVVDMRSLVVMRETGYPVIFDATHSVQAPGGLGDRTGGCRELVAPLARAATAVGIDALFVEVHDDPDRAPCDGPNMIALETLPGLLDEVRRVDEAIRSEASDAEG